MEKEESIISIVTPSHNASEFIVATYNSIKNQTYKNWEWIVVDDKSDDNTVSILKKIQKSDSRIIILNNNTNLGPGLSRNKGIKQAQGDYLTFIDSDDIWFPDFLNNSLSTCKKMNVDFVFSSYERWNETLSVQYPSFIVPPKVNYIDILKSCPISCLTAFICIKNQGKKYMPDMAKRQDYVLWLEYLKVIPHAIGIETPLAKYRMRKNSVSAKKSTVIKYQFLAYFKYQKLGIIKSLFYLCNWAYLGYIKYQKVDR